MKEWSAVLSWLQQAIVDGQTDYMLMNSFVNDIDGVFLGYGFLNRRKGDYSAPLLPANGAP